jgi:hypothetical protein
MVVVQAQKLIYVHQGFQPRSTGLKVPEEDFLQGIDGNFVRV